MDYLSTRLTQSAPELSGTLQQSTRRPESEASTYSHGNPHLDLGRLLAHSSNHRQWSPSNRRALATVSTVGDVAAAGHWEAENAVSLDLLKSYRSRKHSAGGLQLGALRRLRPAAR